MLCLCMLQDKKDEFSLGKKLVMFGETYEDLDEILARYFSPINDFIRLLSRQKFYRRGTQLEIEKLLMQAHADKPSTVHYFVSHLDASPGKFLLSYQGGRK